MAKRYSPFAVPWGTGTHGEIGVSPTARIYHPPRSGCKAGPVRGRTSERPGQVASPARDRPFLG